MSRIIFYWAGIRFDSSPLYYFAQYIDIDLLRESLLRSLYYFHAQPPLFNLFLGIGLKIMSNNPGLFYSICFKILGFVFVQVFFQNLKLLGIKKKFAFSIALLLMVLPPMVLYENWLFYTFPVMVFMNIALFGLLLFEKSEKTGYLLLFLGTVAIIALIRSLFHPIWFLVIAIIIILYYRSQMKKILPLCAITLIIIISPSIKNYFLFGEFAQSTWLGMSLAKMTIMEIPEDKRLELYQENVISDVSLAFPYSTLDKYDKKYQMPKTNIEVLDRIIKKNSDNANFNNPAYIRISHKYMQDFLSLLKKKPKIYAKRVLEAFYVYFLPTTDYSFLKQNKNEISGYENLVDKIIYGQYLSSKSYYEKRTDRINDNLMRALDYMRFHVIVFIIFSFAGAVYIIYLIYKRKSKFPPGEAFIVFNIFYVTIMGNFLEVGENNRFRFLILPFMIIAVAKILEPIKSKIISKKKETAAIS